MFYFSNFLKLPKQIALCDLQVEPFLAIQGLIKRIFFNLSQLNTFLSNA